MINRANVPMWGNARKSAGPAKWPGKNCCSDDTLVYCSDSDFPFTKNSAQPRSGFIYTKNSARPRSGLGCGGDVDENDCSVLSR